MDNGGTEAEVADSIYSEKRSEISGIITFLPSKIQKNGFDRDRTTITLFHLHGAIEKLEHKLVGGKYISNEDRELLENDIKNHDGFYKELPKEAHDVLSHLELMGRQEDVTRYYLLWKQYCAAVKVFFNAIEPGIKICLIMENPEVKVDKTTIKLPSDLIIKKYTENNPSLKLETIQHFAKTFSVPKTPVVKEYKVLLFKKVE